MLFLFLLILGAGVVWVVKDNPKYLISPTNVPETGPETDLPSALEKMDEVGSGETRYRYAAVTVDRIEKLQLLTNFEKKATATDLIKEQGCRVLVNGGFYSREDAPLGWLVSDNRLVSGPIESALFDGYIYPAGERVIISRSVPDGEVTWGLQSGPVLIEDGEVLALNLNKDELARRTVAAVSTNGQVIFMAITNTLSLTSGPLLADLPNLTAQVGSQLGLELAWAINLDGGLASAFISDELSIKEYTHIGSFFCLR